MFYVYSLIDGSTGKVFYVGKGKGDRMYRHVQKIKRGDTTNNPHLDRKIKKLLQEQKEIQYYKSWEGDDENEAFSQEDKRIRELGIENLCNVWFGGKGGRVPTESVRKKISEMKKGKRHSLEHRKKLSEVARSKNRKQTDEWKMRQSVLKKGKQQSAAQKQANAQRGNKNRKFTEEHREKLRQAKLKNPVRFWKNKKLPEEMKDKIRNSVKQTLKEKNEKLAN